MYKKLLRSVVAVALSTVVAYGVAGGNLGIADSGWGSTPADSGWGAPATVEYDSGWGVVPPDSGWGTAPHGKSDA